MEAEPRNIADLLRCHDIRTPLHAMQSGFEILSTGAAGTMPTTARDILSEMTQSCQQLEIMLERLANAHLTAPSTRSGNGELIAVGRLIAGLPIDLDAGEIGKHLMVDAATFSTALELVVCELLEASSQRPARMRLAEDGALELQSVDGPEPESGNHQITAFLVNRSLAKCGWEFSWTGKGSVRLMPCHVEPA